MKYTIKIPVTDNDVQCEFSTLINTGFPFIWNFRTEEDESVEITVRFEADYGEYNEMVNES